VGHTAAQGDARITDGYQKWTAGVVDDVHFHPGREPKLCKAAHYLFAAIDAHQTYWLPDCGHG
jgi:hypothetical protein